MKKFLPFLLTFLLLSSCERNVAKENKSNYSIEINISDLNKRELLYLKKQQDNLSIVIDSLHLENDKALFYGNIELPEIYGIFIKNNPQGIFPIIEEGTIKIEASINDLKNAKIYGTPLNNMLNEYKKNALNISSKMNDLFPDFQKARAENDANKIAAINHEMRLINQELISYKLDFIKNNPESFVSSMVLYSIVNEQMIDNNTAEELYNKLSLQVKKSEFSKNTKLLIDLNKPLLDTLN